MKGRDGLILILNLPFPLFSSSVHLCEASVPQW